MIRKIFVMFFLMVQLLFVITTVFASEIGRYQVVPSSEDNAYLVDTSTGFVWFLGYRTLPTGREPVATPYKFIFKTPQNQSPFLTEKLPGIVVTPSKDDKESK